MRGRIPTRLRALTICGLLICIAAPTIAQAAPPQNLTSVAATMPRPASSITPRNVTGLPPVALVVRGKGNGHGRGMSQWGAYGWATKRGLSWQDILTFYYGGDGRTVALLTDTDAVATPGGVMSVRLQALDGAQTAVLSDNATLSWSGQPGTYGAMVARHVGGGLFDVWARPNAGCAPAGDLAGFTQVGNDVRGPIDFVSTKGADPAAVAPTDLIGLCEPATSTYKNGRTRFYRGGIRATTDANGLARTVNLVATESYVRGVVPRESSAGWGDVAGGAGMNALRAQAVAARSYGLSESRYSYAKTCDTTDCQVYGGAALRTNGSTSTQILEDPRTDRAVAETTSFVIKDSALRIVRTEYTSSNGGRTAGGTFPAKVDEGDVAADPAQLAWTRVFSAAAVQQKYPSIGVFMNIVTTHDGLGGEWNGYATSVTITGTAGVVTRTGPQFRNDFDLYNHWFETFLVAPTDPAAPVVGSILFVGDSVAESTADEIAAVVTPAYPAMDYQACAGRGMAGADCLFTVTDPQVDLDGVGVVNARPAPAIAIVALGYNDDPTTFDAELQQMLAALTAKGVQRVIFVSLSTRNTNRNYARINELYGATAAGNPSVTVWDWNTTSSDAIKWRWFDNSSLCCWVHLSQSGQAEFALFVRAQLDAMRAQSVLPASAPTVPVLLGLPLRTNHRGTMVATVQKRLNSQLALRGSKRLRTDGNFGRATAAAVKKFQSLNQLAPTGVVDRATWDALGLAQRTDLAILRVGSRHPAVASVQTALAKVLKKKIRATGQYDTVLSNHVRTFQKRLKLKVNGRVGPSTWAILMASAARA